MSEMYVLLISGAGGPEPWHWQHWLASQLPEHSVQVDLLPLPADFALGGWLSVLRERLDAVPAEVELVVAAHSHGVALWLHHAATTGPGGCRADRVLLVAPPAPQTYPEIPGPSPYPCDARALRQAGGLTRLVAGTGNSSLAVPGAHTLADELRIELDVLLDGGNLSTSFGYGPWPSVLRWTLYGSIPLLDRFGRESSTAGCPPEALRLTPRRQDLALS